MKKLPISYRTYHDLYALLLFVNVAAIGVFGLRPAFSSILEKKKFLQKIQAKQETFVQLHRSAQEKDRIFDSVQPYIPQINRAYPNNLNDDTLVVDLISLTGSGGYALQGVTFTRNAKTITGAQVNLKGPFQNLYRLLSTLANYEGSVKVESVQVSLSDKGEEDRVNLSLKLYSLQGANIR